MTVRHPGRPIAALLLATLALPLPAFAQDGTGARIAQRRPEAARPAPSQLADNIEDPATLIRLAGSALSGRRSAEAADLLERAEARLLTRAELATEADRPAVGGAIGELASARDAIGRQDMAGAQSLVASALRRLEMGETPAVTALPAPPGMAATGTTVPAAPAWGGGPAAVPLAPSATPFGGPMAAPSAAAAAPMLMSPSLPPPSGAGPIIQAAPLPPAQPFQGPPVGGIVPQNMPVGGTASPPVPIGPEQETTKAPPPPGYIPPASTKPPPM